MEAAEVQKAARAQAEELPVEDRIRGFAEIEAAFSEELRKPTDDAAAE